MKVMLVIPHVSGGGGERVLSELASGLRAEIVVVVFEQKFSYPVAGRLISLDAPIDRSSTWRRALGFLRRIWLFRKTLRQEKPNVVLSFMGEANFINALLAHRPVLTVHTHMSSISKARGRIEASAVKLLVGWLYRRATVVAVSRAVREDLIRTFGVPSANVIVIPNSVDVSRVDVLAQEDADCPWDPRVPVVITAGRLCPEKAHWHLIRAFSEIRKTRACQLVIIGSGELESYLKDVVQKLRIEGDVFFLGWQANPFKFMARADVFALSSMTEAFPLVLLEAMACRVPVIATDSPGGSREILMAGVDGACGVLVSVPDGAMHEATLSATASERELAMQITKLLDDPGSREKYVERALRRVEDFGPDQFIVRYQRLLETTASAAFFPLKMESSIE